MMKIVFCVLFGMVTTQDFYGKAIQTIRSFDPKDYDKLNSYLPLIQKKANEILRNSSYLESKISNSTIKCIDALVDTVSSKAIGPVIDASGKLPSGIAKGTHLMLGNYDECMQIKGYHYCAETLSVVLKQLPTKLAITIGMCVPEMCTLESMNEILTDITANVSFIQFVASDVTAVCYNKEKSYGKGAIVMMFISAVIALLCLVGTVVDVIHSFIMKHRNKKYVFYEDDEEPIDNEGSVNKKEKSDRNVTMHIIKLEQGNTLVRFLLCFSLIKNSKALFDTNIPSGAITAINGIRTLSITWVITGHSMLMYLSSSNNPADLFSWVTKFSFEGILNAPVSVDSFFLLSGLLVSYLSMKRFQTKGSLPLLRYYLHRFIRLMPIYMYAIFFSQFILPLLGDGPLWFGQSSGVKNCDKYWWTNLLFINNIYPKDLTKMCFPLGWYVANDMQFYVISPVILYAMYKLKWFGVILANGIFLLACFITTGVIMHTEDAYPISSNAAFGDLNSPVQRYQNYIYVVPWTRMAPYLVGLILGYILAFQKEMKTRGKFVFYAIGWILAITAGLLIVYGPYTAQKYVWSKAEMMTYGLFFRFAWAIAVAWVIYACHNGYGSLINDFLSWKAFIPLSRLTYAVFLVHIMVIVLINSSSRVAFYFSMLNFVFFATGIIVLSFAVAYILVVTIEYPVFNLEKLMLNF